MQTQQFKRLIHSIKELLKLNQDGKMDHEIYNLINIALDLINIPEDNSSKVDFEDPTYFSRDRYYKFIYSNTSPEQIIKKLTN
ncbi:MAG: hypothetical protein ACOCRX_00670 [Candidatus Woesearchaeota archaeon]